MTERHKMKVKIYKHNDEEIIIEQVNKFELRKNNVVCWYKIDKEQPQNIDDVATIQILES